MIINLSPVFSEDVISAFVDGDKITINGEEFDFGPLLPGQTLPFGAIDSYHFAGSVVRHDTGVIEVTLRFPHPVNASENMRFPAPINAVSEVEFPQNTTPPEQEPEPLPELDENMEIDDDQVE